MSASPKFNEAVRYWEPRRILYNAVLAVVVAFYVVRDLPKFVATFDLDMLLSFIFFVVAANVLYCSAYVVDVFLQYTDFTETWRRFRGFLFVIGLGVAMILTKFVAEAMF